MKEPSNKLNTKDFAADPSFFLVNTDLELINHVDERFVNRLKFEIIKQALKLQDELFSIYDNLT